MPQVPPTSSTFAIALTSTAGASLLSLTAAQVSTIAAVGVLAKLAGVAGILIARRRGRRSAEEEEEEEVVSLEMLPVLEVDDCYKRVICSAASSDVSSPSVRRVLALFSPEQVMRAPLSPKAGKFVEALRYGRGRSVAKCEHRYQCSLGMDLLQDLFQ